MKFLTLFCITFCYTAGVFSDVVMTSVPSGTTVATGYMNYTVEATLPADTSDSSASKCYWKWAGPFSKFNITFYEVLGSSPYSPATLQCISTHAANYYVTCRMKADALTTKFTYFSRLAAGNLSVSIVCEKGRNEEEKISRSATIQNCYVYNLPNNVQVTSEESVYGEEAQFDCVKGTLFYSNGVQVTQTTTQCLANATWSFQDSVECWYAPTSVSVRLHSATVFLGDRVNTSCVYEGEYPLGAKNKYFIGDSIYVINKEDIFTTPMLNASDNGKPVNCQAVTPYTVAFPDSGKSEIPKFLKVLYPPYQDDIQAASSSCEWMTNKSESCNVTFFSNPASEFVSITKNGSLIQNDLANKLTTNEYQQSFLFLKAIVTADDFGEYTLILKNANFSDQSRISFRITDITPTSPPPNTKHTRLIVGICIAIGGLMITLLIVLVVCRTLKQRSLTKDQEEVLEETSDYVEVSSIKLKNQSLKPSRPNPYENMAIEVDVQECANSYLEITTADSSKNTSLHQDQNNEYEDFKVDKYDTILEAPEFESGYENLRKEERP